MKYFRILILVFVCSIVEVNYTFAQTDYVITKNHDTIHCDIKVNFLNGNLKYRATEKDKYIKINPDNVIEYFFARDTSTYVFKKLPRKVWYTPYSKWLVKGRINLYENAITSSTGTTETTWYVSKDSSDLIQVKHSSFSIVGIAHSQKDEKKAFMDLISDFPGVLEGLKLKAYTLENITETVEIYDSEYSKQ